MVPLRDAVDAGGVLRRAYYRCFHLVRAGCGILMDGTYEGAVTRFLGPVLVFYRLYRPVRYDAVSEPCRADVFEKGYDRSASGVHGAFLRVQHCFVL